MDDLNSGKSVTIKIIKQDDAIEDINISEELVNFLVFSPVSSRSNYKNSPPINEASLRLKKQRKDKSSGESQTVVENLNEHSSVCGLNFQINHHPLNSMQVPSTFENSVMVRNAEMHVLPDQQEVKEEKKRRGRKRKLTNVDSGESQTVVKSLNEHRSVCGLDVQSNHHPLDLLQVPSTFQNSVIVQNTEICVLPDQQEVRVENKRRGRRRKLTNVEMRFNPEPKSTSFSRGNKKNSQNSKTLCVEVLIHPEPKVSYPENATHKCSVDMTESLENQSLSKQNNVETVLADVTSIIPDTRETLDVTFQNVHIKPELTVILPDNDAQESFSFPFQSDVSEHSFSLNYLPASHKTVSEQSPKSQEEKASHPVLKLPSEQEDIGAFPRCKNKSQYLVISPPPEIIHITATGSLAYDNLILKCLWELFETKESKIYMSIDKLPEPGKKKFKVLCDGRTIKLVPVEHFPTKELVGNANKRQQLEANSENNDCSASKLLEQPTDNLTVAETVNPTSESSDLIRRTHSSPRKRASQTCEQQISYNEKKRSKSIPIKCLFGRFPDSKYETSSFAIESLKKEAHKHSTKSNMVVAASHVQNLAEINNLKISSKKEMSCKSILEQQIAKGKESKRSREKNSKIKYSKNSLKDSARFQRLSTKGNSSNDVLSRKKINVEEKKRNIDTRVYKKQSSPNKAATLVSTVKETGNTTSSITVGERLNTSIPVSTTTCMDKPGSRVSSPKKRLSLESTSHVNIFPTLTLTAPVMNIQYEQLNTRTISEVATDRRQIAGALSHPVTQETNNPTATQERIPVANSPFSPGVIDAQLVSGDYDESGKSATLETDSDNNVTSTNHFDLPLSQWSMQDLQRWLTLNDLESFIKDFAQLDGPCLSEMVCLVSTNSDVLNVYLKDMGYTLTEVLKFRSKLKTLSGLVH